MITAVAVSVSGQVRLRVYHGERLEIDLPLTHRRALLLGSDLVRLASDDLLRADRLLRDQPQLEPPS